MEVAIKTLNLTKKFGELVAVNKLNLEINHGEIFGLLGPNGAGKTTTIHMLATILRPTEGTALVGGYDILKEPAKVRETIGIVFQDISVDRNLTGYENMVIYGRLYGLSGSALKDRIEELLRFVGLYEWKDVSVRKYSGGMIRRLEIARSLLHEPEILFLDEPTLGLDPHTRVNMWDYIRRIQHEKNITILLTTHYLEEADALCDRIAIIDHGNIIALGTPDELKSRVSGDVVYLKIREGNRAKIECFLSAVRDALNAEVKFVEKGTLMLTLNNAPQAIPKIFELANEITLGISELKYVRPSLNDVFIKLTGRSIRDSSGSWKEVMKMRRAVRMGMR